MIELIIGLVILVVMSVGFWKMIEGRLRGRLKPLLDQKAKDRAEFTAGRMPCCGATTFYEGPSGGMCQNIQCGNDECGQRWNVAIFNGEVVYIERI